MAEWKPPHEETWHISYDDLFASQEPKACEEDWERIFEGTIGLSGMEKRLKLAAAAPEMALMLLELYRHHGDKAVFDWAYWFDEIEKVLAKAGVPMPEDHAS